MVKLYSLNVRGLRDERKRREIFGFLKRKQFDIIYIQESHSSSEIESTWIKEWGAEISFSHHNSKARGTMTLFGKGIKRLTHWADDNGRIDVNIIQTNNDKFLCINVYAPNVDNERTEFFNTLLTTIITNFPNEKVLMAGDFNVTLEHRDKKFGINVIQNSAKVLKNVMNELSLVDIWRIKHPNLNMFTWARTSPKVMCRLDMFLISKNLVDSCQKVQILESVHTDHKLIYLDLGQIHQTVRGRGFFKLNNSLLDDQEYVDTIANLVITKKDEYEYIEDKRVVWDLLKFDIQRESRKISKQKAKEKRELENLTLTKCNELYEKLCGEGLNQNEEQEYQNCKQILEDINAYKEEGARIRSRVEFIEMNEKSNNYFYNKEKESYEKKTVDKIKVGDIYITKQEDILHELKTYYEKLFATKHIRPYNREFEEEFGDLFETSGLGRLTEGDKLACEGMITTNELKNALDKMQNGKSPGSDGLTVDFYKKMWPIIGDTLADTLNYAFIEGELSVSQKRGIITLLQKRVKILN